MLVSEKNLPVRARARARAYILHMHTYVRAFLHARSGEIRCCALQLAIASFEQALTKWMRVRMTSQLVVQGSLRN